MDDYGNTKTKTIKMKQKLQLNFSKKSYYKKYFPRIFSYIEDEDRILQNKIKG